jgi:hypothetical protein
LIQESAEALVSFIERQGELRRRVHLLAGFRNQSDEVAKAATRLEELLIVWRLFGQRDIGVAHPRDEAKTLLTELEQLRERFTTDPEYVLGPNRLVAVKSGVPLFVGRLEQGLLTAWRAYAASRAPGVNPEVLTILANIAALSRQVARVTIGLRELNERANKLPATQAELDQFDKKAAVVNAAWNELDSEHLPAEVLLFLKEAGGLGGAGLERLTDQVRQWLGEHDNLMTAFRIRQSII